MKKLFSILTISAFLLVGANSAMACWGWCPKDVTATGNYEGQARDYDSDYENRGNERAFAEGAGGPGAYVSTYANGYGYAQEMGFILGEGDADAWAWTKDYGKTSKAGAGAKVDGELIAGGEAFGLFGNREWVQGHTYFEGEVYQGHHAEESGYAAGFIRGGNQSYASFETMPDYFGDTGRGAAFAIGCEGGNEIKTKGMTEVSIDPYGQYRSIKGHTEQETTMTGRNGIANASVWGDGGVGGMISNQNGAYAGGAAEFNYSGNATRANGQADFSAKIKDTGNSTSITVFGSSSASLSGTPEFCGRIDK